MEKADLLRAPKVELHVHLDGSFDSAVLFRAARKHLEELPLEVRTPWDGKMLPVREAIRKCEDVEKFDELITVGDDILGLFPILDCFYTFLPIVRGRFDVLEELSYEFCRGRQVENIIYTEVRYSPFEFLVQNSEGHAEEEKAEDAVKAVCKGLQRGQKDFKVVVRQILCCIAAQPSWSRKTAELAELYAPQGVVGVDIASGEMHFEEESMKSSHRLAMQMARRAGLGVTVHAAESGPGSNVTQALEAYGASRIGHGYRALGGSAYEAARALGNVHFELCPTSSVATEAIELKREDSRLCWSQHPIAQFVKDRTSCSINSDDPAIFRCSLTDELLICVKEMGMSAKDVEWLTLEALSHAFNLEEGLLIPMRAKIQEYYGAKAGYA